MRQQVELFQHGTHDCFIMVADYHALNFIQDPALMQQLSFDLACGYMAVGLDPEKLSLFKQSSVPAHTELAWIFDTLTTMPYLMRAHAYKDAEAKNNEISVGTFNYPMLMAADILLYDTAIVPVGQDQKQHIEYARDTAEKFNRTFVDTFALPEAHILESVATVPGIDGRKMSKSYGNTIPLFASRDIITERVMSIVTNSEGGLPENVYAIHNLLKTEGDLALLYDSNGGKYKVLKEALIEDLDAFIAPMRERYLQLRESPEIVDAALARGAGVANEAAHTKMAQVRKAIGVA